jgi:acylphosphatase
MGSWGDVAMGEVVSLRMRVARHYVVSGRVQGVSFRFFTYEAAVREDVRGWVRNQPDGTVEILAEGDEESVRRFEQFVRRGPALADVTHLAVTPVNDRGHTSFTIL